MGEVKKIRGGERVPPPLRTSPYVEFTISKERNKKQALSFLKSIFEGLSGFLEFRLIKKGFSPPMFIPIGKIFEKFDDIWQEVSLRNLEGFHVFFGVCPRSREDGKKESVHQVGVLFTDLDSSDFLNVELTGEESEEELKRLYEEGKKRIMEVLSMKVDEGLPYPSHIVDTGRGFHFYWLLDKPIEIVQPSRDEVEDYLFSLASFLGGDSVYDISRVLRLPGTINWPDESKPYKRLKCTCEVKESSLGRYSLEDFKNFLVRRDVKAATVHILKEIERKIEIETDNLPSISLDKVQVSERIKRLIVSGYQADKSYKSRSEADAAVVCALLKAGLSEEEIFSVFLNPEWRIGEKFREKGKYGYAYLSHTIVKERNFLEKQFQKIHLLDIDDASFKNKRVEVELSVVGVGEAYFVPKRVKLSCIGLKEKETCHSCILFEEGKGEGKEKGKEKEIEIPLDWRLINFVQVPDSTKIKILRNIAGINCKSYRIKEMESQTMTELIVYPKARSLLTSDGRIVDEIGREWRKKNIFFLGNKDSSVKTYLARGIVVSNPKTQASTLIVSELITEEEIPKEISQIPITIEELQDYLEKIPSITKILGRRDAHLGVLLCFSSPMYFYFEGKLQKGWVEMSLLGDTRTGKGSIVTGLISKIGLGTYSLGETASRAGILYGIETLTKGHTIQWGLMPQCDGKLLVIDGISQLQKGEWPQMREARSLGVIKVSRIVSGEHPSRVRLIFIGNAPQPLRKYNLPCQAIRDVWDKPDISRLDFCILFGESDVQPEIINKKPPEDPLDISKIIKNIKYAWKVKPEEISISSEACEAIYSNSLNLISEFGGLGSHEIPLVPNDMKIKLSRLSVSLALLLGETEVKRFHVEYITEFLKRIYYKMGLDKYVWEMRKKLMGGSDEEILSSAEYLKEKMSEDEVLRRIVEEIYWYESVKRLKEIENILQRDKKTIEKRIANLLGSRLLVCTIRGYARTPLFDSVLKKLREEKEKEEGV